MALMDQADDHIDFDKVTQRIGNAGRFQKRFNLILNCVISMLMAMPTLNLIISMAVPDHWCYVPGRDNGNYTLEEWKQFTIPIERDHYGNVHYSKCNRFANISDINRLTSNSPEIVKCDEGWHYDNTWYDLTIPMQNNWVCDNSMVASNIIAVDRAGEVIGSLILGQVSDNYGRMPVFFMTLVIIILGRLMSIFTSQWVYPFVITNLIGSLCSSALFMGPYIISMEISRPQDRAFIGLVGFSAWSIGLTLLPVLMWLIRDWRYFILVTTVPCGIIIFFTPWFIESPRWLVSKGKIKECIKQLEKIAKTNRTKIPQDIENQLVKVNKGQDNSKRHHLLSFLSSWRLAKNTLMMLYCTTSHVVIAVCLDINVGIMNGNPFIQYLFQFLVQLPTYFLGKWICNRFGRRWSLWLGYFLGTVCCIIAIIYVNYSLNLWIINLISIFIKFSLSLCMYTTAVFSMEIYPTCIRQTGTSLGILTGNLCSILSPYIIALGANLNPLIPFVIYCTLLFAGQICCLFLPETRGKQLPETLKDAANFGKDQDIWGSGRCHRNENSIA